MTDDDSNDITEEVRESLEDGDSMGDSVDQDSSDGAILTLDGDEGEGEEE